MANDPQPRTAIVDERSSGGAGTMLLAFVLLLAVLAGGYFLFLSTDSTVKKNDAIVGAAQSVGDTAKKAGDAIDHK